MLNITLKRWTPSRPGPHNDYSYEVLVNNRPIASGEVHGHDRDLGWPQLLRELLEQRVQAQMEVGVIEGIRLKDTIPWP